MTQQKMRSGDLVQYKRAFGPSAALMLVLARVPCSYIHTLGCEGCRGYVVTALNSHVQTLCLGPDSDPFVHVISDRKAHTA